MGPSGFPPPLPENMETSSHNPTAEIVNSGFKTTFEHTVGNVSKKLSVEVTPRENTRDKIIYIANGKENIGAVIGSLFVDNEQKLEFVVSHSKNFSKDSKNGHIPGAVIGTIAHLVGSGIIERWYSDFPDSLSEDAVKMYGTRLANDGRFEVFSPSQETGFRYLVMRKDTP